jgi:YegS/Rv2252/BmrU family lipid kinase
MSAARGEKRMRYKIILNPESGSGSGAKAMAKIRRLFDDHELDYELVCTEAPGHGMALAEQAADQGFDVVVAAGGDGTSNEVINGLMAAHSRGDTRPAMGVICTGRGNDFAHGARIPIDIDEAVELLVSNQRKRIDIGRVFGGDYPQGRYFGNCVGVGFDAVTTIEVSKLPRFGGFLSFLIAVLKTIFLFYKGPVVRISYDGEELSLPTLLVSVMNGQRLGDGFWMAPEASMTDGFFDLCIAEQVSRRRILTLLPHFMRGTQGTQREITTLRGKQIMIEAIEGVLPAQTDGEILCIDGTKLSIELLPQRLEIISSPTPEST